MSADQTSQSAYLELFILDHENDEGGPDAYFICNICGRGVDNEPCPDHAPLHVPGLQLVECDATPRHPRTWTLASEAYPPTCMSCLYADLQKAHAGCDHTHHGRWRRWSITRRLAGRAYWLGIIGSYVITHDAHCHGCVSRPRWRGRRPYALGLQGWQWRCLRRGHRPREIPGAGMCARCYPCPECGSTTSCFYGGCETTAGSAP